MSAPEKPQAAPRGQASPARRPSDVGWSHWWAERLGLGASWREMLYHPVPVRTSPADILGFLTLFAFVNQVVTGILLMVFYRPTVDSAYQSVQTIDAAPVAHLIRGLHFWGANAMIVLVGLHLLRVFYIGAYKQPREFQWVSGAFLLAVTIGFAFSGYLLPWDQQAYWATVVGTAMATYMPGVGGFLERVARGGDSISGATLGRFFDLHVMVLPILLVSILAVHVLLVFVHGQSKVEEELPPGYRAKHRTGDLSDFPPGPYRPFWPYTVMVMLGGALVVAAVLAALAITHPPSLIARADPLNKAHYRPLPVWYFYWIYEMLKHVPSGADVLGIVGIPLIAGFVLLAFPFLDTNPSVKPGQRPFALSLAAVVTAVILSLTYSGWRSAAGPIAPAAAVTKPSYWADVRPLLVQNCDSCHNAGDPSGGVNVEDYGSLIQPDLLVWNGSKWQAGAAVVPGHPESSLLIQVLEGRAKNLPRMPLGLPPLPKADIQTISNWIQQGAKDN